MVAANIPDITIVCPCQIEGPTYASIVIEPVMEYDGLTAEDILAIEQDVKAVLSNPFENLNVYIKRKMDLM